MSKEKSCVVTVRVPDEILKKVDKFVNHSPVKISRSSAVVYLLTLGLIKEGFLEDKVKE